MPDRTHPKSSPTERRAWSAVVSLALLIAITAVSGASAQLDAPDEADVDTRYTPSAKTTTAWVRMAGAEHGIAALDPRSPTPVDVDFYTVVFESDVHGFAGGAQCLDAPPDGMAGDALTDYLLSCERVPVIYEFIQTDIEASWRPVYRGDETGYVGGIAFMRDGTALAVGGDGKYPRREAALSSAETDIAGAGRAWIWNRSFWSKLPEDRMQPGMRGMTALAMSERAGDCGDLRQCGLAGAYRQLWLWRDGGFVQGYFPNAAEVPDGATAGPIELPAEFRFRVRAIRFTPASETHSVKAVAVTSGCCASNPQDDSARMLLLAQGATGEATVYPRPWPFGAANLVNVGERRDFPESLYALGFYRDGGTFFVSSVAAAAAPPTSDSPVGDVSSRVLGGARMLDNEGRTVSGGDSGQFLAPDVSNARLVAGDGNAFNKARGQGQHYLDWAVGSWLEGREGDDQAVAFFTWPRQRSFATAPIPTPQVLECPGGGYPWVGSGDESEAGSDANLYPTNDPAPDTRCQPYPQDKIVEQTHSKHLFELPTYALNAFTFSNPDTEAVGWAVGDRGAIMRLGGVGTTSASGGEPTEPRLGSASTARFAGTDVYDAFRPLPLDAGAPSVPSLSSTGTKRVGRPEFVPGGAPHPAPPTSEPPEDVSSVVMSPDGSEGWAIGAGQGLTAAMLPPGTPAVVVYHYNGTRWSRCDTRGVPNLLPADPACASLAPLWTGGGGGGPVALTHATRVPLENDGDPLNDEEFEVAAVGVKYNLPGAAAPVAVLVRYRDGHWFIDEEGTREFASDTEPEEIFSIAFTAPDDGWILYGRTLDGPTVRHWDGETWWVCNKNVQTAREHCDDPGDRLPLLSAERTSANLAVAGERIYMMANRIAANGVTYPVIIYRDGPDGEWTAADGGYDPGCAVQQPGTDPSTTRARCVPDAAAEGQGRISALGVALGSSGYVGWAVGRFGTADTQEIVDHAVEDRTDVSVADDRLLLRLDGSSWAAWEELDASADYLAQNTANSGKPFQPVILDPDSGTAVIYHQATLPEAPPLIFDPNRGTDGQWQALPVPYSARALGSQTRTAFMRGIAPDGAGGAWLAARSRFSAAGGASTRSRESVHFWHYTRDVPKPVFEEAPHPIREPITAADAGGDGSLWVATSSSFVYRYDRLTGWEKLRIPGWDPGRIVTRTSEANAVAVGPDGEGLVVGKNGRIAGLSPLGVKLDLAAGRKCGDPPCGTARDLRAVAVAEDGSALAGGDGGALLYRNAGDPFSRIELPGASSSIAVTSISMPTADSAWVATDAGQVFAGSRSADGWSFSLENRAPDGKLLSRDRQGTPLPIRAIEVDGDGEGYAVGERGLILERRGTEGWQRIKTGFLDTFRSITLAPQGRAGGALIGGDAGLVLTLEDGEFRVAREADLFDPLNFGDSTTQAASVRAVALVPGTKPGQVEAWAVQQAGSGSRSGPGAVFHYTNDPDDPLLRASGRIEPLPDTPDPREGEISFAAFGRSDCHDPGETCPEAQGERLFHEVVSRRVAQAVIERSEREGGPSFAVFTGDVGRAAGREGDQSSPTHRSRVHRRWVEQVANRLDDAGVPLFGAVGLNDLDRSRACAAAGACADVNAMGRGTGLTWGWRKAMAGMRSPWGAPGNPPAEEDGLRFEEVPETGTRDPVVGEARTHYAVDIERGERPLARLIFLDNSLRTLEASDPNQNPLEPQREWLERVLAGVNRRAGQQAIVVMNTPTYSYVAGDPTEWHQDSAALETTLMQHDVKMVVSGRLGWNGRYWATAPGVHHPCPGGSYVEDNEAPEPDDRPCDAQTVALDEAAANAGKQLADAMASLDAPPPPGEGLVTPPPTGLQGLLPFAVASSAGGTFGPTGTGGGQASDGWWHGYTIVRLDADGDPRKTIVEQRPIFDWISITAASHVLKPRQRMALRGEGREPLGIDVAPRYDAINSQAITHRYDLVLADEQNPSLPARRANGDYTPVTCPDVACIDRETGVVSAGSGRHERVYAVAILSVGDKAASWPIAFEPARSFKPAPAVSRLLPPPPLPNPVPRPPATVVLNQGPAPAAPPPPPPSLPQINVPPLNLPPPPAPPQLPIPTAAPTPTPPPPPAPPPPPGNAGALPLSLEAPLAPVSIVPTVIPPSPPPVNPAPPSGSAARKEARQRQAATAKSEEGGGDQGAGEGQSSGENGAAQMTRRDPTRPAPSYGEASRDDRRYSFSALSHSDQPSAWSRGALYGGMTLATALVLALGWGIARPTPRRRHPPRPAPETARPAGRGPRS